MIHQFKIINLFSKTATLFLMGFLVACSDPNAEIKELDDTELNTVIDKLYIENESDNDTPQLEPVLENETKQLKQSLVKTIENSEANSSIESETSVLEVEPGLPELETQDTSSQIIQTQLETQEKTIENLINLVNAKNKSLDQKPDNNENIISPGFSDPVTESETPSERILRNIIDQHPITNIFENPIEPVESIKINDYCEKISARLSSVSLQGCLNANHRASQFNTVEGNPIVVSEFAPKEQRKPLGKILVIGGTHGDELTSVSTAYKWISNLNKYHSGLFHWHIAPAINADSVLKRPAYRPNANGVDINRNLPTPDWEKQSELRWQKLDKDLRKNPGTSPASEPESQWIIHEIESFKPDAIVSIHAPYGLLDFDSPQLKNAPSSFGRLQLNLLGTYPGSLGNYAGIELEIPVLTLELPNASTMPAQEDLNEIWSDMVKWLRSQLENK